MSYEAVTDLQLWLTDIDYSIPTLLARKMLGELQEVLAVVDEIEVGRASRPGTRPTFCCAARAAGRNAASAPGR